MRNGLTVLLGIILVALTYEVLPEWVTETQQKLLLMGFICVSLFFVGRNSIATPAFSTGGFWLQVLSGVLVLGALDIALYEIFPTAPLFHTPEGYGHLAAYFVLAFIWAVVAANNTGFNRFMLFVTLGVVFALIGPRTDMLLDPDGRLLAKLNLNRGPSPTVNATISNACPGLKKTVPLGNTPVDINPDARCAPDIWHDGKCIFLRRAAWTGDNRTYGPHCGGSLPKDTEWAWSADQPFEAAVALSPPRYN